MNKTERLHSITEIISATPVATQEELQKLLRRQGVRVTQATLSRDLAELGVARMHEGDTLRYTIPSTQEETRRKSLVGEEVREIVSNESMILIRTLTGHAGGVGIYLDDLKHLHILGTVAGDDTVLVIPTSIKHTHSLFVELKKMMGQ